MELVDLIATQVFERQTKQRVENKFPLQTKDNIMLFEVLCD